jgi:hypothetical protein
VHVDLLIRHAAQVVTPRGRGPLRGAAMGLLTVIPDGAVAVREGRIVAVGPTREIEAQITEAAEILEAGAGRWSRASSIPTPPHLGGGSGRGVRAAPEGSHLPGDPAGGRRDPRHRAGHPCRLPPSS